MTFRLFDLTLLFRAFRVEEGMSYLSIEKTKSTFRLYSQRARQRRQLLELSEHALEDIGVTRAEAMAEARKPFWKE